MAHRKWKDGDKVHLAENPKYVGVISYTGGAEIVGDDPRYYVKWSGHSVEYVYYGDALISKEEADKLQSKSTLEAVKDKAKDVFNSVKEVLTSKKESA